MCRGRLHVWDADGLGRRFGHVNLEIMLDSPLANCQAGSWVHEAGTLGGDWAGDNHLRVIGLEMPCKVI